MQNNLVTQSNDLIFATYSMELKEKELLLACVSRIDSRVDAKIYTKQTKFTVTVQEMKDLFYDETNRDNAYRDLKNAADRLFYREVIISLEGNKTLKTRFVSGVIFDPDQSEITLTFAEDILPYLTQLSANFTKYRLVEISELSSIHAIRLYELIICWTGQWQYSKEFELDDFREVMGVEGKYKQFGQLKESVVDKALQQINENTQYKVSVQYRKVGRSFVRLTLNFHKKSLAKIADKEGKLSEDMLSAIVRSKQFEADYNNYHRLSGEGKHDTDKFRSEMKNFITMYPEDFEKKPLENYLK
ncbi:RepB family plasmid replication initiator protein [Psychrobacter sp. APC 3350]|uniref:RepB family plasmid replication initiator protein n=1 Tax=Psychrobacter sp. APC 3350 TaxID=3035195 RepID=UPI0025B49FC9|nr:RepB family plasmid replication initiator protein [Psychrobacter sp. APC 3350]MDN3453826.1 RepB family plasmid replication initiator protein [Psychrobacter sp. APC 3350]